MTNVIAVRSFILSSPHECECVIPEGSKTGWCPYHKIRKTRHWVHLCQTKPGYRKAWDEGRGPGQNLPKKTPVNLFTGKRAKPGPGRQLRRILGCSAKRWPHYAKMDKLGELCLDHIKEMAASLVEHGYVASQKAAERMIRVAVEQAK
jgi:hypothetical protein